MTHLPREAAEDGEHDRNRRIRMATAAGKRKALAMLVDKIVAGNSNARDTASDICRQSFSMDHEGEEHWEDTHRARS